MSLSVSFYHNLFSLLYCCVIVTVVCLGIIANNYNNYELIFKLSMVYFPISIILNIVENVPLFIIHHIVVIIALFLPYLGDYNLYVVFIYHALLAEISTAILTIKFIIKEYDESYYEHVKKNIDVCFAIVFLIVRPFYLSIIIYNHIMSIKINSYGHFMIDLLDKKEYQYAFSTFVFEYDGVFHSTILSFILIILMMSMNYYWTFGIIKKLLPIIKSSLYTYIENENENENENKNK